MVQVQDNSTYFALPKTFGTLGMGSYTIYIKDSSSCVQSYPQSISSPDALYGYIDQVVNETGAGSNGSLRITCSGGSGTRTMKLYKDSATPYNDFPTDNQVFTTGVTSNIVDSNYVTVTGLTCGYYWLYVIDDNGCTASTIEYQVVCPLTSFTIWGGSTSTIACSNNPTLPNIVYAFLNVNTLVNGTNYYLSDGVTPFTGPGAARWSDKTNYGTFDSNGLFTLIAHC